MHLRAMVLKMRNGGMGLTGHPGSTCWRPKGVITSRQHNGRDDMSAVFMAANAMTERLRLAGALSRICSKDV